MQVLELKTNVDSNGRMLGMHKVVVGICSIAHSNGVYRQYQYVLNTAQCDVKLSNVKGSKVYVYQCCRHQTSIKDSGVL